MFNTYFSPEQLLPLYPSLLLIIASILVFRYKENTRLAVILLVLGALGLRVWAALLDPFLNYWDEQYHALVAKHMMEHPFHPTMIEHPVFPYTVDDWTHNHTWLHKQPLYMWQIALSFKMFGMNEFTLRLPSILLTTAVTFCIYRMGKLSVNARAGYYAALLWALSFFVLNLVSGLQVCDHNDAAFVSYITASLWAWTEYEHSGKKRWLVLIGLFAGMAVLVKWLTGMLVFGAWGVAVLFDRKKRKMLSSYLHIAYSFAIAVIIFLPWQLYILHAFPEEAKYNFSLNTAHFTTVIPPHGGDAFYYYHNLKELYGDSEVVPVIVILAFLLLIARIKKWPYRAAFAFCVIAVYSFFTIAATKLPAFCFPVASVIFIALGSLADQLITGMRMLLKGKALYAASAVLLLAISLLDIDLEKMQSMHTSWKSGDARQVSADAKKRYKELPQELPPGDFVIFGCRPFDHTKIMFYTDYTAYDVVPPDWLIKDLKKGNIRIALFDHLWVPDSLFNDPYIVKLKPATP